VIDRRGFLAAVTAALALSRALAVAQSNRPKARVAYLTAGTLEREKTWLAALRQGLRDLGYVEGEGIVLDARFANGSSSRLTSLAEELVRLKLDVLVAGGDAAALAAKHATQTIPIVMVTVADPVGIGLVPNLARPGGNITGLSDLHADLVSKRLEMLKQMSPAATRVAVLLNPSNPAHPIQLRAIEEAGRAMGLAITPLEAKQLDDFERVFASVKGERVGGIMVLGDRFLGTNSRKIADLIARNRLPAVFTQRSWVEDGGLMSYGANFPDVYRRAAPYVDKILKGAKPADLPIEQPTRFDLVVNMKTARALGLTVPPALLARADEIIG